MPLIDDTVRPCSIHADPGRWLPAGHTAGCPIADPPYTIEVDDCDWCIASDYYDAAVDACPDCKAWTAYTDLCTRYSVYGRDPGDRLVAHVRFDRDVTVRTNSGEQTVIGKGEHHAARFVDEYAFAPDLGDLVGFDMLDLGAPQYRTGWWRIAVEWVDCSVVHIPHAYVDDADVSFLGPWTDQHELRYS